MLLSLSLLKEGATVVCESDFGVEFNMQNYNLIKNKNADSPALWGIGLCAIFERFIWRHCGSAVSPGYIPLRKYGLPRCATSFIFTYFTIN